MAVSIDWATKVISVPQADITHVTGTLYELDTDWFRLQLKALEASVEGMTELDTHDHNSTYTVAGVTFARKIEIINGYSVQFTPNSQWSVRLAGSNNNIFDVESGILVQNQVQVIAQNSAGLIVVAGESGLTEAGIATAVWNKVLSGSYTATDFLSDILPSLEKNGNVRTELIEAIAQNATRKVEIGRLDRIVLKYKLDSDPDWSSPYDTKTLYAWYDSLGDTNPIITGESD